MTVKCTARSSMDRHAWRRPQSMEEATEKETISPTPRTPHHTGDHTRWRPPGSPELRPQYKNCCREPLRSARIEACSPQQVRAASPTFSHSTDDRGWTWCSQSLDVVLVKWSRARQAFINVLSVHSALENRHGNLRGCSTAETRYNEVEGRIHEVGESPLFCWFPYI